MARKEVNKTNSISQSFRSLHEVSGKGPDLNLTANVRTNSKNEANYYDNILIYSLELASCDLDVKKLIYIFNRIHVITFMFIYFQFISKMNS